MGFNKDRNRMTELVEQLNRCRDAYYNQNKSLISDREYDALFDELERLEEKTGIVMSNSPTNTVGYESVSQLQKVKHNHQLLSLAKTTDETEFISYFENKPFILMGKLDGLTCSLTYQDGRLVRAESRGNGEIGEDITHNAKVFSNVPLTIPAAGTVIVDGECIITYSNFEQIKEREGTEYKNPRNLVSGTVRQLNPEIVKSRNVKFIAWKLYECPSVYKVESNIQAMLLLQTFGFDVVPYRVGSKIAIDGVKSDCERLKIPIDGVVGMFDDIAYCKSLGVTAHHPKHSLAFKFYQEENETTLLDIEWNVSRTGLINPVAVFDPVEIDGTTVNRATLNNVSIVKELQLGIGDTITVIKANQIIPKVTQNLTRSGSYKIPILCPNCGEKAVIKCENGREMLYCTNKHCSAIQHDKISNFASREGMNIVGISEERLKSLMDLGYVTDFESLYHLNEHRDKIIKEYGFGKSVVDHLINAIEQSRDCKLQNVIVAIGIPTIGKSAAKTITEYCATQTSGNMFQTFINLALSNNDWSTLPAIGKVTSDCINKYIKENISEIWPLVHILRVEEPKRNNTTSTLNGKTFCITGKLEVFDNRNALVEDIENHGGIVVSGVSAKTNYLITNDKTSGRSKNKAAEKIGTTILSENEYIELRG